MVRKIKIFFATLVDYTALWKSATEVFSLTLIALFPLIINIFITSVGANDIKESSRHIFVPGEMLSYCLSFLAPSLYLLIKTHGSDYRLPFIHFFSFVTLGIYILSMFLYVIAKNGWVKAINMENHDTDLYFVLALLFLFVSILFRIYSVYHGINSSKWSYIRKKQQSNFNENFIESLS
jgi:hypothetical protein